MPYTLQKVIAKEKGNNNRWHTNILPIDISTLTINDLINKYLEIHLVLSHTAIVSLQIWNLANNLNLVPNRDITISAYLVSLGNTGLVSKDFTSVSVESNYALYGDAYHSGFKPTLVPPTGHPFSNVTESEKTAILLTKPEIDYLDMADYCLAFVNNMVRPLEGSEHGLYIKNGVESLKIANDNKIGLLSFANIGKIKVLPITDAMLTESLDSLDTFSGATLYTDLRLRIDESLVNKSVIMVLGGYLHVADNTYKVTGDNIISVYMNRIRLGERIYESRLNRSMASLQSSMLMDSTDNFSINSSILNSNSVISKYLSDNSSFIVIVDAVDLLKETVYVTNENLVGTYSLPKSITPNYPLITGYGKLTHFIPRAKPNKWILSTNNDFLKRWRWQSTTPSELNVIDDALDTIKPYVHSPAFMLKISKETITGI